jgi:SAM-dependent MidA family methyltransferase
LALSYFMQCCLSDSKYGYYQKQNPFGSSGDFITAPEISQIFGELIALYAIYQYRQLGSPQDFQVVELGPGNGSLMHDFLRTTKKFPDFFAKTSICLVEISARLQEIQHKKLNEFSIPIQNYQTFSEVPRKPSFIIANEFFDALPILQFEFKENKWYERKINYKNGDFNFCLMRTTQALNYSQKFMKDITAQDGDIFELSPMTISICSEICDLISHTKSHAVIIDYGSMNLNLKPTLQALKNHQYHNIFTELGKSDLTPHVNFPMLNNIALERNLNTNLITQKTFLESLGIEHRANMLKQGKDVTTTKIISDSIERLTSGAQMGELFKVLEIF